MLGLSGVIHACLLITSTWILHGAAETPASPTEPAALFNSLLRSFAPEEACERLVKDSSQADQPGLRPDPPPLAPHWPWQPGALSSGTCLPETMRLPEPTASRRQGVPGDPPVVSISTSTSQSGPSLRRSDDASGSEPCREFRWTGLPAPCRLLRPSSCCSIDFSNLPRAAQ